jgi:predicted metal-dependent phosphoesterase TrpH
MSWLDLHMHSSISNDGEFTPQQLMQLCSKAGLEAVALADHNSVRGVKEATIYAKKLDMKLIPAIELDCSFQNVDLHVLGYGIDISCLEFDKNESYIIEQEQNASKKRLELIEGMGIYFDYDTVMGLSKDGVITGEMIAEVAIADRRNLNNPQMYPYFPGGNRSDNPYVNFYWDFCAKGKGGYVPIRYMSLAQAVKLICSAGGIPVLAHPGNNVKENKDLLQNIIREGIEGIEVYSSYHSIEQIKFYEEKADEYNLLKTIGSDFHGKTKPSVQLGKVLGAFSEEDIYLQLMSKIKSM